MIIDLNVLQSLSALEVPIVFIGSFLFGDSLVLSAAYLTGQRIWLVPHVFVFALLGTLFADLVWFFAGPYGLRFMYRWKKVKTKHEAVLRAFDHYIGQHTFLVLLFIKFLYGTRILTILYLASRRIPIWSFLLFDCIGTAIWLVVMIGIGWLAGRGVANLLPAVQGFEYVLSGIVLLFIVFKVTTNWIEKRIAKKL